MEFDVRGRRAVVVGAARSGLAAATLLARRGAEVVVVDDAAREERVLSESPALRIVVGDAAQRRLRDADLVVLSPGVPVSHPFVRVAREAGARVLGEIELASRWVRGPIVAVTGTKGKSTTSSLIGRMLEAAGRSVAVGGNIGVPLSAQVETAAAGTVHVVEVSSFQLETVQEFHPRIAVVLNVSPDHLDRHGSFESYVGAKARVFSNQTQDDWAVVNADDPIVLALAGGSRARRLTFGVGPAAMVRLTAEAVVRHLDDRSVELVPLSAVRLRGAHLLCDLAAAAAVAWIMDVPPEAMTRGAAGFAGLEHVMEPVGDVGGVAFVNDSKATNVEAACRAIDTFGARLVVILGGRFKGGDLTRLREPLRARGARVVALGEARPLIRGALEGVVRVDEADSLGEAVRTAHAAAAPDGTVLLSPACASFDMFRDYAERGEAFKAEVAALRREREHDT